MTKANQKARKYTAKDILDKYLPMVIRKNKIWVNKDGIAQVKNEQEKYTSETYSDDIVLQVAPKDAIIIEFEGTPEQNQRWIAEIEESCRVLGIKYCISAHEGKSPYLRIYNIKGIPVNYLNKKAKDFLIDLLLPSGAKSQLDETNIGWTLSPVIDHPHWKPKYKGAIHKIIRGTHPLEQDNEYPKELLKKINKAIKITKINTTELLRNNKWVIDFLCDYCCNHLLPKGQRHYVIEKNLAAAIYHRQDAEEITKKYMEAQRRSTNTLRTWNNAIANGKYTEVSVLEIKKYIEEFNIPYEIPKTATTSTEQIETKPITPEEHQILSDPKLLDIIVKEIQEKKVVGERETIECIFIVTNCRLVKNIKPTSSNLNVNDESGLGKDWIVKGVLDILPDSAVVYRTKITPELLTYWHNPKFDASWTWDGKILYIEDISSNLLNSDVFKVFSSGGSKATVLIKQVPIDIEIVGKPSMIVTSYHVNPNSENLRRYPICFCDSSEDQTLEIMKRQSIEDTTGKINGYNPKITEALSKLKRVSVIISYADKLPYIFPKNKYMRTHFKRFLDYIKSSAALHQKQRKKDENGYIIATGEDYDIARGVLLKNTNNPSMIPLTREQDTIFNFFKNNPDEWSSVNDIENKFPISSEWLRKQLKKLYQYGFLDSRQKKREGVKQKVTEYSFNSQNKVEIPLYSEIVKGCSIDTIDKIDTNDKIDSVVNENISVEVSKNDGTIESIESIEHRSSKKQKKSLNDKIKDLKKYCKKLKQQGNKITYETLVYNFDEGFISQCLESDILRKIPDGSYEFGGI